MVEYCQLLVHHAPVLYRGIYDEKFIKENCYSKKSVYGDEQEGYVIRLASSFSFSKYRHSIAKFVRECHVQTNHNWMYQPVVKNGLINNK